MRLLRPLVFITALLTCAMASSAGDIKRPNILFLLSDDHS